MQDHTIVALSCSPLNILIRTFLTMGALLKKLRARNVVLVKHPGADKSSRLNPRVLFTNPKTSGHSRGRHS